MEDVIDSALKIKQCFACGRTDGKGWFCNYDKDGNYLCRRCNDEYIYKPQFTKEYLHNRQAKYNKHIFLFKGKELYLKDFERKGICELCGKSVTKGEIKRTDIHHDVYDDKNPLANTRELCPSCHTKEGWRLGHFEAKRIRHIVYRTCYACGSDKTKPDDKDYPLWYHNRDSNDNVLCFNCDRRYIQRPRLKARRLVEAQQKAIAEQNNR